MTDRPPTSEQIRDDIDRGRTGEKVDFPDPAAAPLGTDDEAAGEPPSRLERRMASAQTGPAMPRRPSLPAILIYVCLALLVFGALVLIVFASR